MSNFNEDIKKFNKMYGMLVNEKPTLQIGMNVAERLTKFKDILSEELNEIDIIIDKLRFADGIDKLHYAEGKELDSKQKLDFSIEVLTDLADLLGDIQVYCASEMAKFGLPVDGVLSIIMQSNFSKMGEDGLPIYDERGKLQKGPNYWKPEPQISLKIDSLINGNSN